MLKKKKKERDDSQERLLEQLYGADSLYLLP